MDNTRLAAEISRQGQGQQGQRARTGAPAAEPPDAESALAAEGARSCERKRDEALAAPVVGRAAGITCALGSVVSKRSVRPQSADAN